MSTTHPDFKKIIRQLSQKAPSTDTRTLEKGDIFIALRGENFDGHDFTKIALQKGADYVVIEKENAQIPPEKQVIVKDTLKALQDIAKHRRSLFQGTMICITGSAGKTSTKEGTKTILSHFNTTFGNEKNFNNHIGVPMTLAKLPKDIQYGVMEIASSHPGEIEPLTKLVQPDIAAITNVYPMHIGHYDNLEAIAEEKATIFKGLSKNGIAIINTESNFFELLKKRAEEYGAKKTITFGKKGDCQLINHQEISQGTKIEIKLDNKHFTYEISQQGEHHIYNSLCILTILYALDLSHEKATKYFKGLSALEKRGKQHQLSLPSKGTYILIDDSYAGQPEAIKLAIQSLDKIKPKTGGRRIAILGEMVELGRHSESAHKDLGKHIAQSQIDLVIGIGKPMKPTLNELPKNISTIYRKNKDGLTEELIEKILQPNDIVLIKGSRFTSRLFEVADELIK